jgi:hypothetical protein
MSPNERNGRAGAEADSVAPDPKRSSVSFRQAGFARAFK